MCNHQQRSLTVNKLCYYLLQAATDTDDMHSQWQALEGLGAVHSHTGNYHRAVKYFQQAIYILSKSGEANTVAHERLIVKLNHALDCNLPASSPQQNMASIDTFHPNCLIRLLYYSTSE